MGNEWGLSFNQDLRILAMLGIFSKKEKTHVPQAKWL